MIHSRAFEAIDDPADPAWSGHATRQPGRGVLRRGVLVGVFAIAAVVFVVASVVRDPPSRTRSAAASPTGPAASPIGTGQTVVVPQAPSPHEAGGSLVDTEVVPSAPATGSGWAPAEVTHAAYSPVRLTGDTSGVAAILTSRLDALARDLGTPIEVVSGWRTNHEQSQLYQKYLAGTGNLAAVPGTSLHEVGRAADVYVDGVPLAKVPGAIELARAYGMHFPVPGEAWHVELVGDPQGSGR